MRNQRHVGADRGERGREVGFVHHGLQVGVGEEVAQLVLDVAVVHVHRHRAQLERGEHAFEVLVAVVEPEADVVAGADAVRGEHMRQPGRALVEVAVGEAHVAEHDRLAVGHGVGHRFEEIGEVELHCASARRT